LHLVLVVCSGHIIATDISTQMLTIAKERATFMGMQDIIEFKESDAENIDLPNSSFDAVLCRWEQWSDSTKQTCSIPGII
jgi:ubiquinone/menaquinone biosynthesis C-methylase UbiE